MHTGAEQQSREALEEGMLSQSSDAAATELITAGGQMGPESESRWLHHHHNTHTHTHTHTHTGQDQHLAVTAGWRREEEGGG